MAFKVEINKKWCKKCGLCAHYCPTKVFNLDDFGSPTAARVEACIGCKMCEIRCPDFAIEVEKV